MYEPRWTDIPAEELRVGDVIACREYVVRHDRVFTFERQVVRVWEDDGMICYEVDGGSAALHARYPGAPVRLVERAQCQGHSTGEGLGAEEMAGIGLLG